MCGTRPGYGTGLIVRKKYSPVEPVTNRPKHWKFPSRFALSPPVFVGS